MGFHSIILLVVTTLFLLLVDSSFAASDSNPSLRSVFWENKKPNRFLRPSDEDNEARGISVPAVETTIKVASPKLSMATKVKLKWWVLRKESSVKVLQLLKLDDGVDGLLTNPSLKALETYISMLNKKNLDSPVTLLETLTSHYENLAVTKMLELGKKSDKTKVLATTLQDEQFQRWQDLGITPVALYKLLNLHDSATIPFGGPVFDAWVGYLTKVSRQKFSKERTVFEKMKAVYGDRALASLLYASKGVPDPKNYAEKLTFEQFTRWYDESITPENSARFGLRLKSWSQITGTEREILDDFAVFYAKKIVELGKPSK